MEEGFEEEVLNVLPKENNAKKPVEAKRLPHDTTDESPSGDIRSLPKVKWLLTIRFEPWYVVHHAILVMKTISTIQDNR